MLRCIDLHRTIESIIMVIRPVCYTLRDRRDATSRHHRTFYIAFPFVHVRTFLSKAPALCLATRYCWQSRAGNMPIFSRQREPLEINIHANQSNDTRKSSLRQLLNSHLFYRNNRRGFFFFVTFDLLPVDTEIQTRNYKIIGEILGF